MVKTHKTIIILLLSLLCNICFGSNKTFESVQALSELTAYKVLKDKHGFIWIGSNTLKRYDGYETKNYYIEDSSEFICKDIYEDSKGNIWTCGERGISRYNRDRDCFIYYDTSKVISNYQIRFSNSIAEDNNGNIWVTSDQGLFKYIEVSDKFKLIANRNRAGEYVGVLLSVLCSSDNKIWVGSESGHLYTLDKETELLAVYNEGYFKTKPDSERTSIYDLFEDSRGLIWLIGNNIAMYINTKTNEQYSLTDKYISSEFGRTIIEDNSGNIWLGSGNLCIFNPDTKCSEVYKYERNSIGGIKNTYIEDLYKDDSGIIWIAGWYGGVQTYSALQKDFNHFYNIPYNNNSLSGNIINDFYEDREGNIWICTEKGSISIFNPVSLTFNEFNVNNNYNSDEYYLSIETANEHEILISSNKAIYSYNLKNKHIHKYCHESENYESVGGSFIKRLAKGNNNNIWVGISGGKWGGLDELNLKNRKFIHHSMQSDNRECNLKHYSLIDIMPDLYGNIWVISWRGIYKYNITEKCFTYYVHDLNDPFIQNKNNPLTISPGRVYCCFIDRKNRLWIGTSSGINIFNYNDESFMCFGNKNGMQGKEVRTILEDNSGNLWLGTELGISKFKLPSAVLSITHDSTYIDSIPKNYIYFENYNEFDGVQKGGFKNASIKSSNGTMYFGGINGFTSFNAQNIKKTFTHSPIVFTEFRLFNNIIKAKSPLHPNSPLEKDISVTESITLNHKQYIFSIKWAALNYSSTKINKYAYYLEGFDKNWNYCGYTRTATYTNLPAGEYIFKVKTTNNDKIWNTDGVAIKIKILPPWWNTLWFKILLSALFICIITFVYIARIKTLKKQKLILENKVNARTNELKKANRELQIQKEKAEQQNITIQQMADELHEADQAKLKYFTNISHEFRTPLTLILAHLDSISEKISANSTLSIRNNCLRLLNMINQLIEIRKTDKGHEVLNVTNFELVQFVNTTTESFKTLAKQKGIALQFYSLCNKINIWLDAEKLKIILNNLLSNAIKYTHENKHITITVKEFESIAVIEVEDEGIGIEHEHIENIFERFYRIGNNSNYGHGIGLNYVKILTDILHGTISVKSKPGEGTVFILSFNKGKKHFHENDINPNTYEYIHITDNNNEQTDFDGFNVSNSILLVEDNEELSNFIKSILEKHFIVRTAKNGKEGINILKSFTPDIIISDILMPIMDGIEFCKYIKTNIELSHIPFVMLTAKTDTETKINGFQLGIDYYIEKPFDTKELLHTIKAILTNRLKLKEYFSTSKVFDESDKKVISKHDKEFWNQFINAISKHYSDTSFNVNDISTQLNMTVPTFYRKFKSLTDQAPAEYLRKYRIHKAAELLKNEGVSISQACISVGFKSITQFRKNFKEEFGKNPSEIIL